jgi:nitroreductase
MDFLEFASQRESCRSFSDKKVEKEALISCIKAAQLSPSACNSQPWRFIIVNNEQTCHQVSLAVQNGSVNKFTEKCPAFIVVLEQNAQLRQEVADAMGTHQYFAKIDIGLTSAHICFEAMSQGLSTCILGWVNQQKLKQALNFGQ